MIPRVRFGFFYIRSVILYQMILLSAFGLWKSCVFFVMHIFLIGFFALRIRAKTFHWSILVLPVYCMLLVYFRQVFLLLSRWFLPYCLICFMFTREYYTGIRFLIFPIFWSVFCQHLSYGLNLIIVVIFWSFALHLF